MGVRAGKGWYLYHNATCGAVEPEYLGITEKQIREYLKKTPMPEDLAYSVEEMIDAITGSAGALTLPDDAKKETAHFVADLIDELLNEAIY